jgi:uncharacterized SAM-binding protein YcdF (DUF218 family)
MFFIVSKVLGYLLVPVHLLIFGALLGAMIARGRSLRAGRRLTIFCALALIVIGILPGSVLLMRPLEDRFPLPPENMPAPAGIIVLGGAIVDEITQTRHQISFGEGAGRLTEAAMLARRYPEAKLVYTGGGNSLTGALSSEAEDAKKMFIALGVAPERILLETRSRNTDENARFTRDLVSPKPDETWLLVTSAYHMPRSMGLFRHNGFKVVAYPVDYHTYGDSQDWWPREAPSGLRLFDIALHEWTGLVAYRLSGKIDEFFPGP